MNSVSGAEFDAAQIALLRNLRKGALLPSLLKAYRQQSADLIMEIRTALGAQDLGAAQRASHTLKSASFSVGAKPMGELSARIEAATKGLSQEDAPSLVIALQERHAAMLTEMESLLVG